MIIFLASHVGNVGEFISMVLSLVTLLLVIEETVQIHYYVVAVRVTPSILMNVQYR